MKRTAAKSHNNKSSSSKQDHYQQELNNFLDHTCEKYFSLPIPATLYISGSDNNNNNNNNTTSFISNDQLSSNTKLLTTTLKAIPNLFNQKFAPPSAPIPQLKQQDSSSKYTNNYSKSSSTFSSFTNTSTSTSATASTFNNNNNSSSYTSSYSSATKSSSYTNSSGSSYNNNNNNTYKPPTFSNTGTVSRPTPAQKTPTSFNNKTNTVPLSMDSIPLDDDNVHSFNFDSELPFSDTFDEIYNKETENNNNNKTYNGRNDDDHDKNNNTDYPTRNANTFKSPQLTSSTSSGVDQISLLKVKFYDLKERKWNLKKEKPSTSQEKLRWFDELEEIKKEMKSLRRQIEESSQNINHVNNNNNNNNSNSSYSNGTNYNNNNNYSNYNNKSSYNQSYNNNNNNNNMYSSSNSNRTTNYNNRDQYSSNNNSNNNYNDNYTSGFDNEDILDDLSDMPTTTTNSVNNSKNYNNNFDDHINSPPANANQSYVSNSPPSVYYDNDHPFDDNTKTSNKSTENRDVINIDDDYIFDLDDEELQFNDNDDFNYGDVGVNIRPSASSLSSSSPNFNSYNNNNNNNAISIPEDTDVSKWGKGKSFSWSADVEDINLNLFGNVSFRKNQLEIINAAMDNNDVFVLMPTGGGKSLCYQIPAYLNDGLTIIISPLISLIQDQVTFLKEMDYMAGALTSATDAEEKRQIYADIKSPNPQMKLLYLTPERIAKDETILKIFANLYSRQKLARAIIDEAHCVSQWGHDFRPDYKELSILKTRFPRLPLMALTATATERVKADVIYNLKMKNPVCFKQSFNRPNLTFAVLKKQKDIIESIYQFITKTYQGKSGIIYCLSKADCEKVSQELHGKGLSCRFYHASMEPTERQKVQDLWTKDRVKIICSTIAFGMGINKPDVRFVIHHSLPKSLEGYYQESGRAGRDGKESHCLLYYTYKDKHRYEVLMAGSNNYSENKENLRRVVSYCENNVDCRRKLQLSYLGEDFNPINCNKTCDNCMNTSPVTTINLTEDAKNFTKIVKAVNQESTSMIMDIFKGSLKKEIKDKKYQAIPEHNSGKKLDKDAAERLLRELVSGEVLRENISQSKYGGAICHISLGKRANDLLRGAMQIQLKFRSEKSSNAIDFLKPKKQTTAKDTERLKTYLVLVRQHIVDNSSSKPHHILSEDGLDQMAQLKPTSLDEISKPVFFGGKAKVEKYGKAFLAAIQDFSKGNLKTLDEMQYYEKPVIFDLTTNTTTTTTASRSIKSIYYPDHQTNNSFKMVNNNSINNNNNSVDDDDDIFYNDEESSALFSTGKRKSTEPQTTSTTSTTTNSSIPSTPSRPITLNLKKQKH